MERGTFFRLSFGFLTCMALTVAPDASASSAPSIVEIAPPPAVFGTDAVALRSAVAADIRQMDAALIRDRRRVVVSLAVVQPAANPVACNVNATVRDARTGRMLAVIETDAHAAGPVSPAQRKELAYAAVRNAVRKVPVALRERQK